MHVLQVTKTGQSGQGSRGRTAGTDIRPSWTGQRGEDKGDRAKVTGQSAKAARAGQLGHDSKDGERG